MRYQFTQYCGKCAIRLKETNEVFAVKMRPIYIYIKGKRKIFAYVCPNCGHMEMETKLQPKKRHLLKLSEWEYLEALNIFIPKIPKEGEMKK
jgi:hypothetical protein